MIERVRKMFDLPAVKYVFFNTGLEMEATKRHVKEAAEKYGVEIETVRPKINVVTATRKYGIPFVSKMLSSRLEDLQRKNIPLEVVDEFEQSEDKVRCLSQLNKRYSKSQTLLSFLCSCDKNGKTVRTQDTILAYSYLLDFMKENPLPFKCSSKCCTYCKKNPAKEVKKGFEMVITGERQAEGGVRSITYYSHSESTACFTENADGQFRLRPLYYVSDADKEWYKNYYNIRYSDAYEVYGFTRTGCCGCSISSKAVEDLERLKPYEPNLYKAAWNVFGESYRYRQKYDEYRHMRQAQARAEKQKRSGALKDDNTRKEQRAENNAVVSHSKGDGV